MTARTVVLGGTGYIGAELVDVLLRGRETPVGDVVVVGRRDARGHGPHRVLPVPCDLSVPGTTARLARGADLVVHLVADSDEASSWRASDGSTETRVLREVLDAAADRPAGAAPPRVLLASTAATLTAGPPEELSQHERTKRALEGLLGSAVTDGRVHGTALRLGTVYGAGAGGPGRGLVATLVRRAMAGEPLLVWRGADVERDLVHVHDVATAFLLAARSAQHAPPVWSVAGADRLTVPEVAGLVAEEVAEVTGRRVPVERVDPPPWAVTADFRDVRVDGAPLRRATGWHPRRTVRTGVRELITLYQETAA